MSTPSPIQPALELSEQARNEIDHWLSKFPADQKRSAVIAALHAVQHEKHYLDKQDIEAVARYLQLETIEVWEVATFYSIFETKKVGKHHISICNNIACMLRGSAKVTAHIENKLGIKTGESTSDGKFYLKQEEECLAACNNAPMMMIDHVYHENLTEQKIDEILDKI